MKYDKHTNYFEIWLEYEKNVVKAMENNLHNDISAGYDILGKHITRQIMELRTKVEHIEWIQKQTYCYSNDEENYYYYRMLIANGIIE